MPYKPEPVSILPGLGEAISEQKRPVRTTAGELIEPRWCEDGMTVFAPYMGIDGKRYRLRCIVACAAGNHARVVNERYSVDHWYSLDDLRVRKDAPQA